MCICQLKANYLCLAVCLCLFEILVFFVCLFISVSVCLFQFMFCHVCIHAFD